MKVFGLTGFAAAVALLCGLAGAPDAAAQAVDGDHIATANGDIVVHPVHHGSVAMTWNGKVIFADPAPLGAGAPADGFTNLPKPDVILITHVHGDHFSVSALMALAGPNTVIVVPQSVADMLPPDLKAKAKILANGATATVATVPIEAVAMYNVTPDRLMFHPKGVGNGYVLTLGGKRIYIAGDTEETPELKVLPNIDVAFVPMNLPYTMTVEQAAQWVKDFKPKIAYPYHYGMSDVNQFTKLVGSNGTEIRLRKWY